MVPGTPVFIGEQKEAVVTVRMMAYRSDQVDEQVNVELARCKPPSDEQGVTWFHVTGLHDASLVEQIGCQFHMHPLLVEDILNTRQRPKLDTYPHHTFIVMRALAVGSTPGEVVNDLVCLVLGPGYVISFGERDQDLFEPVRERIRNNRGRIRTMGADYLAYALMDAVTDQYFAIVEELGDQLETLEDAVMDDPRPEHVNAIHQLKRGLLTVRKGVWPLREVVGSLQRGGSDLTSAALELFWRDLYDHTIRIVELVEGYRDILAGIHDSYMTGVSNRMNEIMKVLTIIATVFIPLTFIAGVYGMNFEHMPELKWRFGYLGVWILMVVVATLLVLWFRRKKWL